MLTGYPDLYVAIDAINSGDIFRFLTKPCPKEDFIQTLQAAQKQYLLVTMERELLEKTLNGSIKILVDILATVNPIAFGQSSRLKDLAGNIARRLNMQNLWEVELAAMLSQIGCITIPGTVLEKRYRNQTLSGQEREMFSTHPQIGKKLLANIPRLEIIADAIGYQLKQFDGGGLLNDTKKGPEIPFLARILKVLIDFDTLIQSGKTEVQTMAIMHDYREWYDPQVFTALEAGILQGKVAGEKPEFIETMIGVKDIVSGMILADDVYDQSGMMLIAKGREITEVVKIRLLNFANIGGIIEPIKVLKRVSK